MIWRIPWLFDGSRWIPNASMEWAGTTIRSVVSMASLGSAVRAQSIVVPGLINLHAHLELSRLEGILPRAVPFPVWVRALQSHTRTWTPAQFEESAAYGIQQCLSHGTTTVLDVGNSGMVGRFHGTPGLRLFAMRELIGSDPGQGLALLGEAKQELGAGAGLCAHAPYSCSAPLIQAIARDCQEREIPFTMHLAESSSEAQLYDAGVGPYREWLDSFYAAHPFQQPRGGAWQVAQEVGAPPGSILAHGNLLQPPEMRAAAEHGCTLVHCPQSARWFGHPALDLAECKRQGLPVALGSDSLASAESLSIWEQMRCLWERVPELACAELLAMATRIPGKALDRAGMLGTLQGGAPADFLWIELENPSHAPDGAWLRSGRFRIKARVVEGKLTEFEGDMECQKSC